MTRPNITEGEWRVNAEPDITGDVFSDASGLRRFIAVCPNAWQRGREKTHEQWRADSRAIAAVPDLLAALEGLLADKYLADPINADRMAPAKAALTKAGYTF